MDFNENGIGTDILDDIEKEQLIETQPIGKDQLKKAMETLKKYKEGKSHLEDKIKKNELWWKMRHWDVIKDQSFKNDPKPASGWLFNVIISKHADFMDSFPSPDILPREEGDRREAKKLSSIIPVVLEQNKFESVYSDEVWYKLKNGTGVYGIFWDKNKLNGLGDISVKSLDIMSLYWEPGVTDIQDSRNFFTVELVDVAVLEETYPEHKGEFKKDGDKGLIEQYIYDDHISTENKCLVIDWYYKKMENGKKVLHYCKFVDDIVLYATENDTEPPTTTRSIPLTDEQGKIRSDEFGRPIAIEEEVPIGRSMAERGWYDHGKYPFVFDVLFKEEGLPTGFGFVDICKNSQISIDLMNNAFEKNLLMNANPRYFSRIDGGINKDQFVDPNNMIVDVDVSLGQDSILPIQGNQLSGNYINVLQNKIDEMKETAGNRDVTTGGTTSGATAASAIAAMQESAGKTSRDMIKTSYRAYEEVVTFVIDLIRQFYDLPRQFRIIGDRGNEQYVSYENAGLQPQYQGEDFGVDQGYRVPVFDIKVKAEKESRYTQLAQNEMALQFYNSGFFNPEMTDQVLACLDMMEFEGKEAVREKVAANGGMFKQMLQMQQQMLQMAQMIDRLTAINGDNPTNLSEELAAGILGKQAPAPANTSGGEELEGLRTGEQKRMTKARQQAAATTAPR